MRSACWMDLLGSRYLRWFAIPLNDSTMIGATDSVSDRAEHLAKTREERQKAHAPSLCVAMTSLLAWRSE